jgi:hypothetical protein
MHQDWKRRWLAVGLVVAGTSAAVLAQAPAPSTTTSTPSTTTTKDGVQPFNPLGDPSRFTKLGGWGAFGGMMGQFGLSKAMLVSNPGVQEELKLSKTQKEELKEWEQDLRKRGETMFRPGGGAGGEGAPQGPPGGAGFNPLAMMDNITNLVREGETGLAKILDKKQSTRVNQLVLQMEGVSALGREDIALAINLSPEQSQQISEILNTNKNSQMTYVFTQAMSMRMNRGGGGPAAAAAGNDGADAAPAAAGNVGRTRRGRPATAKAGTSTKKDDATATKKAEANAEDENPEEAAKRRTAMRERMQGQITKMREGTDKIQNDTVTQLLKVLSKKQRERFEKLLGPPFDPSKFTSQMQMMGPQGMRRDPSETAGAAPSGRPADPNAPATARPAATTTKSKSLRDRRGSSTPEPSDK